ncbi:CoB--CoM heterodisulfide reductase iron-sulfur subunit B family protein [Chloroflexota bacterium]
MVKPAERETKNPMTEHSYSYYPGCSLHSTAKEFDVSTRLVCETLGIDLKEIDGWICCGASAAHSTNHLLSLALPAYNIKLAEKAGLPIVAPCAMCYSRLKITLHEVKNEETGKLVEKAIDDTIEDTVTVHSILDVLDLPISESLMKKSLSGLKTACYYGCLLVRPQEITNIDDENNPQAMDQLVARFGAESIPWGLKSECCGASLPFARPDIVHKLSHRLLATAKRAGADCIIAACPMCQSNLDLQQKAIQEKYQEDLNLPIIYITQLVGLALGLSPEELLLDKHFVDPRSLLSRKGLI